jgi:hypothetical protein
MAKNDDFLDLDALDEFEEVKEEKPNDEFEDIESSSFGDDDDLLNEADDDKKKKKEKRTEAKKEKEKSKGKVGKILLASVLPASVTLIGGLVLGMMMGSTSTTPQVKPIEAISNKVSLEDRVSNIKDSQMSALNAQIANLLKNTTDVDNKAAVVNGLINQAIKENLNNLMGAVLADNPNKSDNERIANIKQYFEIQENTASDLKQKVDDQTKQVTDNMNNFVASNSLAKQLGTSTAKAGNVFASVLAVDRDLSTIYQVIVPTVANDNTVYETLYIVRLNSGNKVTAMSYIGYVNGDEGTGYYDSFEELIKNKIANADSDNGSTQADNSDVKQNTKGVVKENKSAKAKSDKKSDKKEDKKEETKESSAPAESSSSSQEQAPAESTTPEASGN